MILSRHFHVDSAFIVGRLSELAAGIEAAEEHADDPAVAFVSLDGTVANVYRLEAGGLARLRAALAAFDPGARD